MKRPPLLGRIAPTCCFRKLVRSLDIGGCPDEQNEVEHCRCLPRTFWVGPSSDIAGTPGHGSADIVTLCLTPGVGYTPR